MIPTIAADNACFRVEVVLELQVGRVVQVGALVAAGSSSLPLMMQQGTQ
jgi:hypothetical protein